MDKEITKLTKLWYEIVSTDHHKDRDCHWYIYKIWSYGDEPHYNVEHIGYIGNQVDEDFDTYKEAEKFLYDTLYLSIRDEKLWAKEVLATEGKDEYSDDNFYRARKILKIIEKGGNLNE